MRRKEVILKTTALIRNGKYYKVRVPYLLVVVDCRYSAPCHHAITEANKSIFEVFLAYYLSTPTISSCDTFQFTTRHLRNAKRNV
jgi:hypothetical protein